MFIKIWTIARHFELILNEIIVGIVVDFKYKKSFECWFVLISGLFNLMPDDYELLTLQNVSSALWQFYQSFCKWWLLEPDVIDRIPIKVKEISVCVLYDMIIENTLRFNFSHFSFKNIFCRTIYFEGVILDNFHAMQLIDLVLKRSKISHIARSLKKNNLQIIYIVFATSNFTGVNLNGWGKLEGKNLLTEFTK